MKTRFASSRDGGRARQGRGAMALALVLALGALVLSPVACRRSDDGPRGQSGSEGPAGVGGSSSTNDENLPCPCGVSGIFLRVTLLESSGERRRLRVEELIHGETDRAVGDELEVEDFGELPCLFGSAPVADGQQALALFRPLDAASCDTSRDAGGCPDGGVLLTPWGDDLLFAQTPAGDVRVPASELGSLWSEDVDTCVERHGDVRRLLQQSASDASANDP